MLGPRPLRQEGARGLAAESPLKLRAGSESWAPWSPGPGSPKVSLCTNTELPDPRGREALCTRCADPQGQARLSGKEKNHSF